MWVEGAGPSFEVDVQKTDTQLSLGVGEFTGDDSTILSVSQFLDIEVEESPILSESDQIDRRLFRGWSEGVTALGHKPLSRKKFCAFTVTDLLV